MKSYIGKRTSEETADPFLIENNMALAVAERYVCRLVRQ
jgi:hypothetical protein